MTVSRLRFTGRIRGGRAFCTALLAAILAPVVSARVLACIGDCNTDGEVTINELLLGVNIALGNAVIGNCSKLDRNGDSQVTVDELLVAVNEALNGCLGTPVFPANYRASFTEVRDCRFSIEHGGVSIRVLANPVAVQPYLGEQNPLPAGSIVIKEEFDAPDCSDDADLIRWRVMRKEAPGFDPQDGDWHWQQVAADRTVVFDDKTTCITCHTRPACLARDLMCTEGGSAGLHLVLEHVPAAVLSIAGTSAADVYAVGADPDDGFGPYVLHYDGRRWRRLNTGASGDLWWVSVTPIGGAFYMAGDGGLILQYEPSTGTFTRHVTPGSQLLFGIWGSAPDNLWAVGGDLLNPDTGGVIWHFDGNTWQLDERAAQLRPDGLPALFKVWGRSANDLYVVGRLGIVLHFDGTEWTEVPSNTSRTLFTIHGNDSDVAAVGGQVSGLILESTGAAFEDRAPVGAPQMNGVFIRPDGSGIAVGVGAAVALRDATGWELQSNPFNTALDFHATWSDPEGGIWAVGGDLSVDLTSGMLAYGGSHTISSEIVPIALCPPSTLTGPTTVSYANDIKPLLSAAGCTSLSCHGGPFPSSLFDLRTYDTSFGPGAEAKSLKVCNIAPGAPDASYVIEKLGASPRLGGRMPQAPRPPLRSEQIELIRTWILEGAQNN